MLIASQPRRCPSLRVLKAASPSSWISASAASTIRSRDNAGGGALARRPAFLGDVGILESYTVSLYSRQDLRCKAAVRKRDPVDGAGVAPHRRRLMEPTDLIGLSIPL